MSKELTFNGRNKSTYVIDDKNAIITKSYNGSEPKQVLFNDLSNMYLDFAGIKIDAKTTESIKQYLLANPFTTFMFCTFNKETMQGEFTIEQIIEKLAKHPNKLLSTYATSVLFFQQTGLDHEQLMKYARSTDEIQDEKWKAIPEQIKMVACSFDNYYNACNMKTYNYFPEVKYSDFIKYYGAIRGNSKVVEQVLKILNIPLDSPLYEKTKDIWQKLMQGVKSQSNYNDIYPILNLTCTYSVYGLKFKDKEIEKLIIANQKAWAKNSEHWSLDHKIKNEPNGIELVHRILIEKVNTNTGLNGRDAIKEYLTKKFSVKNYFQDPEAEKQKMIKWFMKNENSVNVEQYTIETSQLIKNNVDHSVQRALYLVKNYQQKLQNKPVIPQELQKFVAPILLDNVQTPKIFQQVKELLAKPDSELSLQSKINIVKFMDLLNKNAIAIFKDKESKQINLPDVFSRYFSNFIHYFNDRTEKSQLNEISKYFVMLMERRNELPSWILKGAFDDSSSSSHSALWELKDNLQHLDEVADFLKKSDNDLYKMAWEANSTSSPFREYLEQIQNANKKFSKLEYIDGTDYQTFKFLKTINVDPKDPQFEEKIGLAIGKFIIEYSQLDLNIKKVRAVKAIKNIKAEDLQAYNKLCRSVTKSFADLIREKNQEVQTVRTYAAMLKTGFTGEKLQKYVESHMNEPLTHKDLVVYEDENYTCFIPTFADLKLWAAKMHNCMEGSYLGSYAVGRGCFLYIVKKGQFTEPLNATYIQPPGTSNWYGGYNREQDNGKVLKLMTKNQKYNLSTEDKNSPNYKKPKKGLFEGMICTECKNNGRSMYNQPAIYALQTYDGKYQIQTVEERENLYAFCKELLKKLGFDGASYFADFDRKMEQSHQEQAAKGAK